MSERKKRDELRIRNFELRILNCRMGGRNGVNGVRRQETARYSSPNIRARYSARRIFLIESYILGKTTKVFSKSLAFTLKSSYICNRNISRNIKPQGKTFAFAQVIHIA